MSKIHAVLVWEKVEILSSLVAGFEASRNVISRPIAGCHQSIHFAVEHYPTVSPLESSKYPEASLLPFPPTHPVRRDRICDMPQLWDGIALLFASEQS